MIRRVFLLLGAVIAFGHFAAAQNGQGALKGKLTDVTTGEPLPFVNLVLEQNGAMAAGGSTDFDGVYNIKPLSPGKYDLKVSYIGYKPQLIKGIVVTANKITFQDVKLEGSAIDITEFEVIEYTVPLIDKDGGATGATVTRDDIDKMPGRSVTSIATTVGGVYSEEGSGDISVRGSRGDATFYYIDGIKVRGSTGLPKAAIEQVQVVTGGLPANYGDATGGVISVTTRGASSFYFGGIEVLSSGFRIGDKSVGLDPYAYNLVEGSLSGPLLMKKDADGKKTEPILGFFLSGNYTSIHDDRPAFGGLWRMKDETRDQLVAQPFKEVEGESVAIYNADFLDEDDFYKVKTRWDAARKGVTLSGKLDVNTGPNVNLTFGGSADINSRRNFSYSNSLMNSNNNGKTSNLSWRAFTKFTQRFGNADANAEQQSASTIKNAFYTVMIDYSKVKQTLEDAVHGSNVFNYGYIGNFDVYSMLSYGPEDLNGDGNPDQLVHNGWADTLVVFTPSDVNSEAAAITTQYFTLFDDAQGHYQNFDDIRQGRGLLNGDRPDPIYNTWRNIGERYNTYQKTDNTQFRVSAQGSADIGDHAISLGFEYEQRNDRFFSVTPYRSSSSHLWEQIRLLVNSHIAELDTASAYVDNFGTLPRVTYDRLNAAVADRGAGYTGSEDFQPFVDYSLRTRLGLDPDGTDFIDVFSLDPELFTLDMFEADELLNSGSSLVNYAGFDHTGNRLTSKPTFNDFFNQRDENNNYTRAVPAFEPLYIAGYVMDKFAFDDIIFNVGLRVDRYDGNQMVLKDPYSLFETIKAGEVSELGGNPVTHPDNIGDDYVVYVNNLEDPNAVVGYRTENRWFNNLGEEISDPQILETPTGIAPLLVVKDRAAVLNEDAFEDYKPQVIAMPRVAFSFPISDEATFFAHYDILSKRPTFASRLDPIGYMFLQQTGGGTSGLSNPNLRPEKTIDYELGFQQVLSKSSSLKISAFYRELRDMVSATRLVGAYPRDYTSYTNFDFGTVKGMTVTYDLRRTGNVRMNVAYTLQFAEGTGSDAQTGLNLANTGQPNLRTIFPFNYDQRHAIVATVDYRYGEGKDYNGPVWFGKPIFQNTGINVVSNLGAGTPYSRRKNATAAAQLSSGSSPLQNNPNGSTLPWTFRTNAQIDRNYDLKWGSEEKPKTAGLQIYMQINNLFNNKNITGVYGHTGNPDDDGYLNSAENQPNIQAQNDEEAFRMYYTMKMQNPFNFGLPRTIRLGARLSF